jgi:hypothetical protein
MSGHTDEFRNVQLSVGDTSLSLDRKERSGDGETDYEQFDLS